MHFTTRTKITVLFTLIVAILIAILAMIALESASQDWQKQQGAYVDAIMKTMYTPDEAKMHFDHLQILSDTGVILFQKGIFASVPVGPQHASFLFHDGETYSMGSDFYYIVTEHKDGNIFRMAKNFTDVIQTRDMIVERFLLTSVIGLLVVLGVGYFFSGYILRPIRQMQRSASDFSLENKNSLHHTGITGHPRDDVVVLARSLESLFVRVQKEAQKLEQFSDDIAHEIKNKLFSIESSLDIALHTPHRELGITKAKTMITELSRLVDALLFFSRSEAIEMESTDLDELIRARLDLSDPRIEYIPEARISERIAPDLFVTALENLISNARKFTPKTGTITLILRSEGIEVRDTGRGIAPSDLTHIFDRLWKGDISRADGSGYGIGLAMTRKIIEELHGMRLSVESVEGEGTSFFILWNLT